VQGRKNTEGQRSVDWDFTEGETSVDLSTGTSQRGRPLSTCRLGFHRGGTSVNLSTGTLHFPSLLGEPSVYMASVIDGGLV
jgi:hypothetical protein